MAEESNTTALYSIVVFASRTDKGVDETAALQWHRCAAEEVYSSGRGQRCLQWCTKIFDAVFIIDARSIISVGTLLSSCMAAQHRLGQQADSEVL